MPEKTMTVTDVLNFHTELENLGIQIWLTGGWGVDAVLEEQTRPHTDMDIVIQEKDVQRARELLEGWGYTDVERDDTSPWNFVLGDDKGNGIYGPADRGEVFPADSLSGIGEIEGHFVKCISPEWQVKHHTGYKLRERDFKDISALCEKFGMDYPEEYTR